MKRTKRGLSVLLSIVLVLGLLPTVIFAATTPTVTIGSATAALNVGDTVSVDLTLSDNPGIVGGAVDITFDNTSLALTGVENRTDLLVGTAYYGYQGFPITSGSYSLGWDGDVLSADITANGVLATLVFTIVDGATPGDKDLAVTNIDFVNFDGASVTGTGVDGKITLTADVSTVSASITAPAKGGTPQTAITATEYTGTISWDPKDNPFAADTVYTATVELTAKAGYQFTNATTVTVDGSDSVSTPSVATDGSTVIFTATFPKTASKLAQTLSFANDEESKTYGDAAFTVTASQTPASGGGTVTYASSDTTVATVTNSGEVTILKAGSTTITATAAENDDYATATDSYTLTVAPLEATLSWSGNSFNYDGNEHAPTATVSNLISGDSCTVTVEGAQTNAGSYTATATELSNANYKLPANATYGFTINTVTATVDTAPAAVSSLEYTGSAQALVTAGTATGGEMQYRLAPDSTYSAEIPTGTNAGTYNVYYKVDGDANHDDVAEAGPIAVTIAKGTNPATLTASEVNVKIGNSMDLSSLVSGAVGTVSYAITGGTLTDCSLTGSTFQAGTSTGDCVVTITMTDSENNYNDKTLSLTVTVVTKDTQDLTFTEPTVTKIYGDAAFTITPSQTPASGGGDITYESSDTTVATVDANSGEVTILKSGSTTITATAAENSDYALATASYTLTVNKAPLTVKAKDHTITYGDAPANNGAEYIGFVYNDTESVLSGLDYTYNYVQYDNVGEYKITPADTVTADNYTINRQPGKLTVEALEATLSWTGDTFDYDGFAHVPTATVSNLKNSDTCTVTVSGGQTDAGDYTATATKLSNTNYKLPTDATHAFKINKIAATVTAPPAAISGLEYTGSAQALVTAGTANGGEMQYSLTSGGTYSATIPTGTDAGTYNVYYKVVGDNNHNDTTEAGPVAVTIAQSTQTLAFANATVTKTYGDAAFTVTASQTPASGGGDVTYASSDTTVAAVTNSGEVTILKAGSATITATAAENTNYLSATASYTLTVDKAEVTVTAKDHTITYGDAPANNGVEYSGFKGSDTQSVVSGTIDYNYGGYTQYDNVGSYTITPDVSGLSADNYTFTAADGTLTVDPKEAVLSWTGDSFDYDGSAHAPTAVVENLAPGDSCNVTVTGSQTNAGDYTATATELTNANYKLPANATHPFTINKAASAVTTVPAAVSGLEYTGSAQALVSAGAANGGEVQYRLATDSKYSADIPTGTDAGTYNVYYKVVGDANHNDVAEAGPIAVTIAKGTDPAKLTATTVNVKLEGTEDLSALVSEAAGDVSYTITSTLDGCSVAEDGTFTAGAAEGSCVVTVAVAESTNYNGKTVGTITVNVMPVVETPVLSESSQTFSGTLNVTINYTTGAAIYYTLDGTDPTSASTPYTEGDTISITETTTLKVIAIMPGYLDSEIAEATYTKRTSGAAAAAPETNTITPATAENGTVTVSPKEAAAGDTVTITPTPDEGYQVGKVVVKDADGNEIEVTEKDGKYTFTMPDSEVTIETVFEEASETPSDTGRFIDVHEGDYYYEPVEWAAENGITNGITKDKFGPALGCTRAQVVTFLWIAYGSQDAGSETGFDDVDLSDYYDKAVAWAVSEGITAGTAPNEFSPDLTVTRCQFVTMLWVSRGMPEAEGTMPFTDVPADAYYAKAVAWAYANDITAGKSATKFGPDDPCTRGQIVTFLYNALAE